MQWNDPRRFNLVKYKSAQCKHFLKGSCKRGESCTFAHGANDLKKHLSDVVPPHIAKLRDVPNSDH